LPVSSHIRIEQTIYFFVGIVMVLIVGVVIFGNSDHIIWLIQLLPVFIPILIILGAIRLLLGPRGRPLSVLKESWATVTIAAVILIIALYAMLFFGFS